MRRLNSVQAIRAIASFAVAGFHIHQIYGDNGGNATLSTLLSGMWIGVDVFFVLSGFIMWYATTDETKPGPFAVKRVLRIYTALWPALLLAVAVGTYSEAQEFSWPTVLRSLTLFDLNPDASRHYLYVTWSLTYELVFYLAFTLLLWVGRKYAFAFAAATILMVEILSFTTSTVVAGVPPLFVSQEFYEFLAGAFVAKLCSKRHPRSLQFGAAAVGIMLIAAQLYFEGWVGQQKNLVFAGGGTALILFAVPAIEPYFAGRLGRGLATAGDWSYAMYLLHPVVIFALRIDNFWWEITNSIGANAFLAAYLVLVVATSWFYFRFVESPMLRLSRSLARPRSEVRSPTS